MYNYTREICKSLSTLERNNGKIVKNSDGTVDVYYGDAKDVSIYNKSCCETLGFNFDIDRQKCYWSNTPKESVCSDCTTKVVYNPRDNDGVVFNVNASETCELDISLDYLLNFDCDLFSKTCSNNDNTILIEQYQNDVNALQTQVNSGKRLCENLTKSVENLTTIFNGLCYVIKGVKSTTTVIERDPFVPWINPGLVDGTNTWTPDGSGGGTTTTTTTGGGTTTTTTGGGTTTTTTGGGTTTTTTNGGGRGTYEGIQYTFYDITNNTWVDTTDTTTDLTGGRTPLKPYFNTKPTTNTTSTTNNGTNIFDTATNSLDSIPVFYTGDGNITDINGTNIAIKPINDPNIYNNILPVTRSYNDLKFVTSNFDAFTSTPSINQKGLLPPPFAWQWKAANLYGTEGVTPTNTTTSGPVSYCLTEKGLSLWGGILGRDREKLYLDSFGCDESTYTQSDFNAFLSKINIVIQNDYMLVMTDYVTETTQAPCDKKIANDTLNKAKLELFNCNKNLEDTIAKLNTAIGDLNNAKSEANNSNSGGSGSPISNLENLQIHLNLEVETTPNNYTSIYEEPIFNIGNGNLLNYILTQSPNTGIFISGTTAGGILAPAFGFDLEDYATTYREVPDCNTSRTQFIKDLYLQQYKGNYDDPTTPEEELALNKKMNAWYNSSWLYYKKRLDETIVSQIINKKIKISLRIENCCLDLCILTDNLNLTKSCESLDNQEIIISESPKFEIEKVLDNKKSWVSYTENTDREHDLQFRETQYDIDDYRLSINTKEIDLKIDGANAIEEDVLCIIDCLISGDTSYSNTGTTITSTTVTTTAGECQITNSFGYLYNWYTAVDTKNVANPDGGNGQTNLWKIGSMADWEVLALYIMNNYGGTRPYSNTFTKVSGYLKSTGTIEASTGCWYSPNSGATNSFNFDALPSGQRNESGLSSSAGYTVRYWTTFYEPYLPAFGWFVQLYKHHDSFYTEVGSYKYTANSIRLFRDATTSEQSLPDGTNSVDNPESLLPYIGNDGKVYKTTKIGTQIWLAQDLLETKFNDQSNIIEVISDSAFTALTSSARSTYIGYDTSLINCTGITTDCPQIQVTSTTVTTVANTCCVEKCDYGHVIEYPNSSVIKPPTFKAWDTYVTDASGGYLTMNESYRKYGIFTSTPVKKNVHVWWDNSLIDEIEGMSSCDAEDYASWNRAHRDAVLKAKNQLDLATMPYEWAHFEIPNFQIEKYHLNRECSTSQFRIGEAGPGGIVAYVDETGQHGLIVSIYFGDAINRYWHATNSDLVGANNDGLYSGQTNTSLILSTYGSEANAAKYANDYTQPDWSGTIYSDYYLPSKYELNLVTKNWREIGFRLSSRDVVAWSSTENDASTAWGQNLYYGTQTIYNKDTSLTTMMVRKF